MTPEEINALSARFQALAPQMKDAVMRYLDLLLQAQESGLTVPQVPVAND